MSLITRMLTDLDHRLATAGEGQSQSVEVRRRARPRWGNFGPLHLLILVAGAAGIGALLWNRHHRADAPAAQVVAAMSVQGAKAVPEKPAPASGNGPPQVPAAPVAQAVSDAVSAPSKPAAATRGAARPEAAAVRKDSARIPVARPVPARSAQPEAKQTAAKPAAMDMTMVQETRDASGKAAEQANAEPKSLDSPSSSFKSVSPKQRSENLYRQAVALVQQSRVAEAQQVLREAIGADAANDEARQLLAELLANTDKYAEATALLREGIEAAPGQRNGLSGLSMALARLQVANGAKEEALATLEHGLPSAGDDADYHAFVAALLQGQGRHAEAVQHYITALRSNPAMHSWLIGVGISLQAENKLSDAGEAFQRAIDTGDLTPEVAQFAQERLEQIRQKR